MHSASSLEASAGFLRTLHKKSIKSMDNTVKYLAGDERESYTALGNESSKEKKKAETKAGPAATAAAEATSPEKLAAAATKVQSQAEVEKKKAEDAAAKAKAKGKPSAGADAAAGKRDKDGKLITSITPADPAEAWEFYSLEADEKCVVPD